MDVKSLSLSRLALEAGAGVYTYMRPGVVHLATALCMAIAFALVGTVAGCVSVERGLYICNRQPQSFSLSHGCP